MTLVPPHPSPPPLQLLERVYDQLRVNNPELADRKRHTMKPPQVFRLGTTKTCWSNFMEICVLCVARRARARPADHPPLRSMKRQPDHVMQFFLAELGTDGSIDQTQRFLIRGKFVPKKIESLLRKYIGARARARGRARRCSSSRPARPPPGQPST